MAKKIFSDDPLTRARGAFIAVTALSLVAVLATFQVSDRESGSQDAGAPVAPASTPVSAGLPVPFSVFASTAGLKIGVRLEVTVDGKNVLGTITGIGKDAVTVHLDR